MADDLNIEDVFYPEAGKLNITPDEVTADIVDEEMDAVQLTFNNDGCVTVDAKDYSYLTLSRHNLHQMLALLDKAEEYFDSEEFDNLCAEDE